MNRIGRHPVSRPRVAALGIAALIGSTATAQSPVIEPFGPEIAKSGWTVLSPNNGKGTGQRLIVERAPILSVSVALVTGNHMSPADDVTLRLEGQDGRALAVVTQTLRAGSAGWVRFTLPSKGLDVQPGTELTLWLANRHGEMFGWRYGVNQTKQGGAIMIGRPDPRFDFLYRLEN